MTSHQIFENTGYEIYERMVVHMRLEVVTTVLLQISSLLTCNIMSISE